MRPKILTFAHYVGDAFPERVGEVVFITAKYGRCFEILFFGDGKRHDCRDFYLIPCYP